MKARSLYAPILLSALLAVLLLAPAPAAAQVQTATPFYGRSTRALGMGNTGVAVGGDSTAVFYNPAGLRDFEGDYRFVLLDGMVTSSKASYDLFRDAMDTWPGIADSGLSLAERTRLAEEFLLSHAGDPISLQTEVFPHYIQKGFCVGVLFETKTYGVVNDLYFPSLELENISEIGPVAAYAHSFFHTEVDGRPMDILSVGITGKLLVRSRQNEVVTAADIANGTFKSDDIHAPFSGDSRLGVGFDLGLKLRLPIAAKVRPAFGIVWQDIGDTRYGPLGKVNQTVDIGFSTEVDVSDLGVLTLALDLRDLNTRQEYIEKLGLGAEMAFKKFVSLRLGMDQGHFTCGADLRLWIVKLNYALYFQERGNYEQIENDLSHAFQVSFGWPYE